jgi:hypothetical protein
MNKLHNKFLFALLLVVLASSIRMLTIYNFSPIAAVALFSGALFGRKYIAFIFPLVVQFVSDILVNTYVYNMPNPFEYFFKWEALFVYPCYIAIALLGMWVGTNGKYARVPVGALASTALFFIVTNFGAWLSEPMYTKDFAGLVSSYTLALPFVKNSFIGDALFSAFFFGAFYVAQRFTVTAKVKA